MVQEMFNVQISDGRIGNINRVDPDDTDIDHEGVVIGCQKEPKTITVINYGKGTVSKVPVWRILLEQKLIGILLIAMCVLAWMLDPMDSVVLILGFGALGLWMLLTKCVGIFYFKPFE